MKIVIGSTTYTKIESIGFSPSLEALNNRLSIDTVVSTIITTDNATTGSIAELRDDDNNLWFRGVIVYGEKEEDTSLLHIEFQSELVYLDRKTMPAKMYSSVSLSDAVSEVTNNTGCTINISAEYSGTISGFCPEQTARERLQHILFATGLYVKSTFTEHPTIVELYVDDTVEDIPIEKTYWRPKYVFQDFVSSIKLVSYAFREGTPASGDEYVEAGGKKYIVTRTDIVLTNPSAPALADNQIIYDSVKLINSNNGSDIASLLATYYFQRTKVNFEAINNGEYFLGEKYTVMMNGYKQEQGYLESCSFSFGVQTKGRMVIGSCEPIDTIPLTVHYVSASNPPSIGRRLAKRTYHLVAGAQYEITNPYIKTTIGDYTYVFRPSSRTISGTMGDEPTTREVNCYTALRKNNKTDVLTIISVDEVNRKSKTESGHTVYEAEIE